MLQFVSNQQLLQPKKEPEKIEVFVDGKAVHVEPNTTVLQVIE